MKTADTLESALLQLPSAANKPYGNSGFLTVEADEIRTNPTIVIAKEIRVSSSVADVVIPGRIDRNKRVTLSMCVDALQFELVADGYNLRRSDEEWRLTCNLSPRLPTEIVRYLDGNRSSEIDLEQFPEERSEVAADFRHRDGNHPVAIYETHDQELYLISGAPAEPRRPMRLSVRRPRNTVLVGTAQWQASANGKWLIGYSFLIEDDRKRFRRLCESGPHAAFAASSASF
jgi:hypothetical protein